MQGVPDGIDLDEIRRAFLDHEGVKDEHHLHVWALASKEVVLTTHVVAGDGMAANGDVLRAGLAAMLDERFGIEHSAIQMEAEACHDREHS